MGKAQGYCDFKFRTSLHAFYCKNQRPLCKSEMQISINATLMSQIYGNDFSNGKVLKTSERSIGC